MEAKRLLSKGEWDRRDLGMKVTPRLPPMMIGSILFPVGFFILGWTSSPNIHWFPSMVGLALVGASFLLIFQVRRVLSASCPH